jgi:hypothetical protein
MKSLNFSAALLPVLGFDQVAAFAKICIDAVLPFSFAQSG